MFYIIYNQENKQLQAFKSKKSFNIKWLNEFKRFCAINHISPTSLGAKCEIVPLGEDATSLDPVEVKNFANWIIVEVDEIYDLEQYISYNFSDYQKQIFA